MTSVMATGAVAKREYNVTIPSHIAPSVTKMWDAGYYANTQWYVRGQTIFPAVVSSIWNHIFNKTKRFTVLATFPDGGSINFEYDGSLVTTAFKKIDSTAQKDGQGYNPNRSPSYYNSAHDIDIIQKGGETSLIYTSQKTCNQYTITSSSGESWTGRTCYYTYAN